MPKEAYKESWERRSNTVSVMMTDAEVQMLDDKAANHGLTRSAYVRTLLYSAVGADVDLYLTQNTSQEGNDDDGQG